MSNLYSEQWKRKLLGEARLDEAVSTAEIFLNVERARKDFVSKLRAEMSRFLEDVQKRITTVDFPDKRITTGWNSARGQYGMGLDIFVNKKVFVTIGIAVEDLNLPYPKRLDIFWDGKVFYSKKMLPGVSISSDFIAKMVMDLLP